MPGTTVLCSHLYCLLKYTGINMDIIYSLTNHINHLVFEAVSKNQTQLRTNPRLYMA